MELWQIASLMTPGTRSVAESPEELNRRLIAARHKAAQEGRELNADEVFGGMSESQIKSMSQGQAKIE